VRKKRLDPCMMHQSVPKDRRFTGLVSLHLELGFHFLWPILFKLIYLEKKSAMRVVLSNETCFT
jgi:hypothetical protein